MKPAVFLALVVAAAAGEGCLQAAAGALVGAGLFTRSAMRGMPVGAAAAAS